MTHAITLFFIAALIASLLTKVWLAQRQLRHVAAHRQLVPVDFQEAISLADHQKAADYTRAKVRQAVLGAALDTLLAFVMTLGGVLGWLQTLCQSLAVTPLLQGVAVFAAFSLLSWLVSLPLSLYATFVTEARFGFNTMSLRLYLTDLIKGALVGSVIGLPLLALALWLVEQGGSLWWLWTWGALISFNLLMVACYPTLIAPLFNRFTPLEDDALKARITTLLERCGFASRGVFVMDGSTRSRHGNAYFTGLGRSKRIVFFDTLLKQLAPDEIEAVLAHELGHFKGNHIRKHIAMVFALSLALLFILGQLMASPAFFHALGVDQPSPATGFLLFLLVMPALTFPLTPLGSWLSRRHEYEADAFAARQSDGEALTRALVKLYRDNASTLTPDPVYSAFYDSHPPASLRIQHLKGIPR